MSDQPSSYSPRLWRGLGLGAAALGLAAGPAAALSPSAPQHPTAQPLAWQVQAESGEAGEEGEAVESGEQGVAAAEGGEAGEQGESDAAPAESGEQGEAAEAGEQGESGDAAEPGGAAPEAGESGEGAAPAVQGAEAGEAGESGAMASDDPAVAILGALGLIEGHLRIGQELAEAGDEVGASIHTGHPGAEIYESLEPLLDAQDLPGFEDELEALEHARMHGATPEEVEAAYDTVMSRIGELRATVGAEPADQFAAMAAMLQAAAREYEAGVQGGAVTELEEYQDARGFVAVARDQIGALAGSPDAKVAGAAGDALAALAETDAIFPALTPAEGAAFPADAAQILYAAAARVELAGLQVD